MKLKLFFLCCFAVFLFSCGNPVKKAMDKAIGAVSAKGGEMLVEKLLSEDGKKVDLKLDSDGNVAGISVGDETMNFNTGGGIPWPDTLPSSVPEFKAGTIMSTSAEGKQVMVMISGIKDIKSVKEYKGSLASRGWAVDQETEVESFYTGQATKEDESLSFTFSEGVLILGWAK